MINKFARIATAFVAALCVAGPIGAQSYTPTMRYPNPDGDMNSVRRRGPCLDPWVTIALEINYGRADPALCAPALYKLGRWGTFDELVHAVAATKAATGGTSTLRVVPVEGRNISMIGVFRGGSLVAAGGGNLVAAGGGNLVAAGGGNMVSIVSGRLVAAGGGNMVAAGGGNLAPVAEVKTSTYGLKSGQSISLPAGTIAF